MNLTSIRGPRRRDTNQIGFAVITRRWVVGRFFAWLNRNRRLAKDFEATIKSVEAISTPPQAFSRYDGWPVERSIQNGL